MHNELPISSSTSDNDFENIVDISPIPILIHKMGLVLYMNSFCIEMLEYDDAKQIIGKNLLDFVHLDDKQKLIEAVTSGIKDKKQNAILETRMISGKGNIINTETKSSTVHFRGEECRLAVVYNYSHIAKVEEDLKNKNLLIEKIAELIPDSLIVVESKSRKVLFENKPLLQILGYTDTDLNGADQFEFITRIINKNDIPKLIESRKFLFDPANTGKYISTEYRIKDKTGKWRWILARSTMFKSGDDGIQQINFGISQDITYLKEVEEELLKSKLFAEKVMHAVPNQISIYDTSTNVTVFENYPFYTLLGYTEKHAPKDIFQYFDESYLDTARANFGQMLQMKDGEIMEVTGRYRTSSGDLKYLLVRVTPFFRNEKNEVIQLLTTTSDVSELFLKNVELEKYITSNTELEKFAYIASHDLREPLRSIVGFAQLLQKRNAETQDSESKEFLQNIIESGQRMNLLIHGLLDYSKVTSAGKPFEPVNMVEVVKKVRSDIQAQIDESGAEIIATELPFVWGDELQLRQLLQNIVSNGIKFSRPHTKPVVRISAKKNNDLWTFAIEDNGIGLDMRYKEKVFQIFSRLHTSDKYHGSGIGLAVCKRIIERHGGNIWLDSVPEKGTTVYFTIASDKP